MTGASTTRIPPALASIQAARSMTRVAAVTGGSLRRVSSATWSAARAAQWYSSPTVCSAIARGTLGGAGLSRRPTWAARSQSMRPAIGRP